jgi:hypothetical protein
MAAGAGLLVGLALGGLLQVYSGARDASLPSVPLDAEPGSDASARDLEALRAALAAERTERLALGVEVARLRSVLEQLASESEEGEAVPGGGASQAQPGGAADLPAPSEVAASGSTSPHSSIEASPPTRWRGSTGSFKRARWRFSTSGTGPPAREGAATSA